MFGPKGKIARAADTAASVLWRYRVPRNWCVAVFFATVIGGVFWHVWKDAQRPDRRLQACIETTECVWHPRVLQCLCACATEPGAWPSRQDGACNMGDEEGQKPGYTWPKLKKEDFYRGG